MPRIAWPLEDGVMNEKMKKWIDEADYSQLLRKWRFAPTGDPFFQGEIGDYYAKIMAEKKEQIGDNIAVAISKEIGWKLI